MDGIGSSASAPRHAMRTLLRLMFSVYMALCIQSAGDETWHDSLISIRRLSRRLMFFISFASTLPNLALSGEAQQCRKWAITLCCRRIAGENNRRQHKVIAQIGSAKRLT